MLNLLRRNWGKEAVEEDNTPIKDVRYVVVDTELTGLNARKDTIVSIGAVRVADGKIDLADTYYGMVNPYSELTRDSVVIHGITPSDVAGKPGIDKVLREFIEFCGRDVVVGHCVDIDMEFINKEMKRTFGYPMPNAVLDTLNIHEWLKGRAGWKEDRMDAPSRAGLYELAMHYGIPTRGVHNALMDAFITAQIFQRFMPMLVKAEIRGIGDLMRLGDPLKGRDRFGPSASAWGF